MGIRSTALSVTSIGLIGTAGYMADALITGVVGMPFCPGLGAGAEGFEADGF